MAFFIHQYYIQADENLVRDDIKLAALYTYRLTCDLSLTSFIIIAIYCKKFPSPQNAYNLNNFKKSTTDPLIINTYTENV
jgi:hypothetical protein